MNEKIILVDDLDLAIRAHDILGAEIELEWLAKKNIKKHRSSFQDNGFCQIPIPVEFTEGLNGFFQDHLERRFYPDDINSNYFSTPLSDNTIKRLNEDNIYFQPPDTNTQSYLVDYLSSIQAIIEEEIGSCWKVLNVRAWKAKPGTNFGPSDWHIDGGSRFMRKLMIYPLPLNIDNGTIDFFDRKEKKHTLITQAPTAVLLDSSVLLHRGRPGRLQFRPAIEVTITPSKKNDSALLFAGQNARYPKNFPVDIVEQLKKHKYISLNHVDIRKRFRAYLGRFKRYLLKFPKRAGRSFIRRFKQYILRVSRENLIIKNSIANVNIGGGPLFDRVGWTNLEGGGSESNIHPFFFTETCTFPIPSGVVEVVYSSHCFEHLNDSTVDRVLQETRRILNSSGKLILKLPDFEQTLHSWKNNDLKFFDGWGVEELLPLWRSNGVEDNLTNRASMMFCGYWNEAYGDHFSRRISHFNNAYHGPAKASMKEIENVLSMPSCHEIASKLVKYVKANEVNPIFNHQNAWSKLELEQLLNTHGFNVVTFDKDKICKDNPLIPDILKMKSKSIYCVASLM